MQRSARRRCRPGLRPPACAPGPAPATTVQQQGRGQFWAGFLCLVESWGVTAPALQKGGTLLFLLLFPTPRLHPPTQATTCWYQAARWPPAGTTAPRFFPNSLSTSGLPRWRARPTWQSSQASETRRRSCMGGAGGAGWVGGVQSSKQQCKHRLSPALPSVHSITANAAQPHVPAHPPVAATGRGRGGRTQSRQPASRSRPKSRSRCRSSRRGCRRGRRRGWRGPGSPQCPDRFAVGKVEVRCGRVGWGGVLTGNKPSVSWPVCNGAG